MKTLALMGALALTGCSLNARPIGAHDPSVEIARIQSEANVKIVELVTAIVRPTPVECRQFVEQDGVRYEAPCATPSPTPEVR